MEDKDLLLSRIANHQLMFGSFNTDSSIVYGRMGLVLFFFHYARYTENTLFEDFGGEILDEIFDDMHTEMIWGFESGLCGIAWGIEYLLANKFISGDSNEVLFDIDQKIISMYAKGMTTRQISETIEDIYGFETSEGFISDVTDKILPQIEDWQNRPLDEVYPILYIDAIHYSVRDNGVIRKLAAYVILGINTEGKKEVLSITVGDNESSKYWLSVLNELKNRGVKDILIICADGLSGIKEAIAAAFPKTEYQRCIVHQVRNTLKYVPDKDRKAFASDLKTIYHASDEEKARLALDCVTEKWTAKYPNSMKRWYDNWDAITPIFKFSPDVRKVIYTTNAIESLNSTYRKLNRQRSVFPSDTALLKALYLATFEATKKWTTTIRNWAQVYGELSIMYEGRLPE